MRNYRLRLDLSSVRSAFGSFRALLWIMQLILGLLIAAAILLFTSSNLWSQGGVNVTLTFNGKPTVQRLFGREPARSLSMWQFSAKNQSPNAAVLVDFADIHANAGQILLIDVPTARGIMIEGDKLNPWVRVGRFTLYAALGVGTAAAADLIQIPARYVGGLLLFANNGDKIAAMLRGESPPTMENFERIHAAESFVLEPGAGRWGAVFSVPYTAEEGFKYQFVIPEGVLRRVNPPVVPIVGLTTK